MTCMLGTLTLLFCSPIHIPLNTCCVIEIDRHSDRHKARVKQGSWHCRTGQRQVIAAPPLRVMALNTFSTVRSSTATSVCEHQQEVREEHDDGEELVEVTDVAVRRPMDNSPLDRVVPRHPGSVPEPSYRPPRPHSSQTCTCRKHTAIATVIVISSPSSWLYFPLITFCALVFRPTLASTSSQVPGSQKATRTRSLARARRPRRGSNPRSPDY